MSSVPPEEQYETDTIFSQEGEVPDSYLQTKLREIESDNDIFSDCDNDNTLADEHLFTMDSPAPTSSESFSFNKMIEMSKHSFEFNDVPDSLLLEDDVYDVTSDSFRYGRVTSGTSYNLMTGRMKQEALEIVKERDEENDEMVETVTEDEETHRVTTEVKIPLNGAGDLPAANFLEIYNSQMPRYFEYRTAFPQVHGIWTILFDQLHYPEMSTFELQASICAALNSKHRMMICIGVDEYNTVTGVEMSARDRVVFRMALTRAVAGEFQPPLVKVPPQQLTGVIPMKHDIAELTSSIDVLFVPVIGAPTTHDDNSPPNRFLVVVRLKELSDTLYQLSSGRIYAEQEGRVVEMASLDEAFRVLIVKRDAEQKPVVGSMFMMEPEVIDEDSFVELERYESDGEELVEEESVNEKEAEKAEIVTKKVDAQIKDTVKSKISTTYKKIVNLLDEPHVQNFAWLMCATVVAVGVYKTLKPRK